jgi:methylated-DNA-protein-cysteine methyltransferase-like protein
MANTKNRHSTDNFFADVYEVAKLIPKGRVTSYGAIANYLGLKSSARMVGWAMHACPNNVPAHRVVNSSGLLTGKHHFKPPSSMQKRLEKEGVKVKDDRVVNFREVFWDPSKELT